VIVEAPTPVSAAVAPQPDADRRKALHQQMLREAIIRKTGSLHAVELDNAAGAREALVASGEGRT